MEPRIQYDRTGDGVGAGLLSRAERILGMLLNADTAGHYVRMKIAPKLYLSGAVWRGPH